MRLLIIQLNKKKREYKKSCQRIPESTRSMSKRTQEYIIEQEQTLSFFT